MAPLMLSLALWLVVVADEVMAVTVMATVVLRLLRVCASSGSSSERHAIELVAAVTETRRTIIR